MRINSPVLVLLGKISAIFWWVASFDWRSSDSSLLSLLTSWVCRLGSNSLNSVPPSKFWHSSMGNFYAACWSCQSFQMECGMCSSNEVRMALKTELTRVRRPPDDGSFPFHAANLFSIFSIKKFHSDILGVFRCSGNPRYFGGQSGSFTTHNSSEVFILTFGSSNPYQGAFFIIYFEACKKFIWV